MRKSFALATASVVLLATSLAQAETLYGVDPTNNLYRSDSASVATVTAKPITGLLSGDTLIGLDARPANGLLYGLGTTSRIYVINPSTAVATVLGSAGAFTTNGTSFGFDFNPVPDRIRVVSDNEQSLRINPNDGTLSGTDTSLSPAGNVVAAAYDRNFARVAGDTTPTTLFGIDSVAGTLVRIGGVDGAPSPNLGAVTTIGSLGLGTNLQSRISFDISISGTAYAAVGGGFGSTAIYTINLTSGLATLLGNPTAPGGVGAPPSYTGFTAAVPEPTTALALTGLSLAGLRRRRR